MQSETSKCRERLKKFCIGDGLDIGYGGDPVVPSAITIDLPEGPYCRLDNSRPQNLHGDCSNLHWFKDGVFDYVYSSHLLEDFSAEEIPKILLEWLRVLKIGGYLILYCPDEQAYRDNCKRNNSVSNEHHKNEKFGLNFLLDIYRKKIPMLCEVVHSLELIDIYSFELVLKKVTDEAWLWR